MPRHPLKAITMKSRKEIIVFCPYCGAKFKVFNRSKETRLRVYKKVFCKICLSEFLLDFFA